MQDFRPGGMFRLSGPAKPTWQVLLPCRTCPDAVGDPPQSSGSFAETMQSLGQGWWMNNLKAPKASPWRPCAARPTRDVVDAIMTAEQSLQTATAIRDKLVTAYLEIARMQI
jgi:flagellar hook-basal body complex protein FliE